MAAKVLKMSYDQAVYAHMYIDSSSCATSFNSIDHECGKQDTLSIAANTQRAHCICVVDCRGW
jgi:hypothetical protein